MKVIAINGSSRKDGNTSFLIKETFKTLEQDGIDCEMIQLAGKKLQAEEQAALQKVMKDMGPKVDSALKQIISAEGITLVVNSKAAVYSTPAHNITAKLTERLNKAK